jgi:hypothetical protein
LKKHLSDLKLKINPLLGFFKRAGYCFYIILLKFTVFFC